MATPNPPPPAFVGPVVKVVVEILCQSVRCQFSMHYNWPGGAAVSNPDLSDFVTAWNTLFLTDLQACLPASATLVSVTASEVRFGVAPTVVVPYAPATVGSVAGTNLPLEMAVVIAKYTNLKGKHGRGRLSMPAVSTTFTTPATDPNVLNAAGLTAYGALVLDLNAVVVPTVGVYNPVVTETPVPPDSTINAGAAIQFHTLRPTLGTVRRRKPGRGI